MNEFSTVEDFLSFWNLKPAGSFSKVCRNIVIGGMLFDSVNFHVYEKFVHAEIVLTGGSGFKSAVTFSLLNSNNWTMEA